MQYSIPVLSSMSSMPCSLVRSKRATLSWLPSSVLNASCPGDRPYPTACLVTASACSNAMLSKSSGAVQFMIPSNERKTTDSNIPTAPRFHRRQAVPESSQAGEEEGDGADKPPSPLPSPAVAVGGGSVRWYGKSATESRYVSSRNRTHTLQAFPPPAPRKPFTKPPTPCTGFTEPYEDLRSNRCRFTQSAPTTTGRTARTAASMTTAFWAATAIYLRPIFPARALSWTS